MNIASSPPLSGWYLSDSTRYCFLISGSDAPCRQKYISNFRYPQNRVRHVISKSFILQSLISCAHGIKKCLDVCCRTCQTVCYMCVCSPGPGWGLHKGYTPGILCPAWTLCRLRAGTQPSQIIVLLSWKWWQKKTNVMSSFVLCRQRRMCLVEIRSWSCGCFTRNVFNRLEDFCTKAERRLGSDVVFVWY